MKAVASGPVFDSLYKKLLAAWPTIITDDELACFMAMAIAEQEFFYQNHPEIPRGPSKTWDEAFAELKQKCNATAHCSADTAATDEPNNKGDS